MFRISFRTLLFLATAMAMSALVWAHSESELAKRTPPHGGLLASAGVYDVELVLTPDRVQVYLTDHLDQPMNTQGITGTANLRVKGKKAQRVQLRGADDRLEGAADIPVDAPVTVLIMLNIDGTEQMLPYTWPTGGPKRKPAGQ